VLGSSGVILTDSTEGKGEELSGLSLQEAVNPAMTNNSITISARIYFLQIIKRNRKMILSGESTNSPCEFYPLMSKSMHKKNLFLIIEQSEIESSKIEL
jgi:hypothetical protein